MTDAPNPSELSPAARARRDAMLPALLAQVDRTRRIRSLRRIAAAAGVPALAIVVATAILWPRPSIVLVQPVRIAQAPAPRIEYVTTRSVSPDQLISSRPVANLASVEVLDDARLLQTLADAGRPTGLITIDGHTRTTRDITDPISGG